VTGTIRRRASLLISSCLLIACTSATGAGGSPPPAPSGGAVISAQANAFDREELVVPAGRPFQLLFENREAAPHNVTIKDEASDLTLFVGEIFGGPGSRTYDVPAIPAGTHQFRCDVHPEMTGTITAR
jgi:plastocyanin